jgi:K+-sensing histidine kinase KdpD
MSETSERPSAWPTGHLLPQVDEAGRAAALPVAAQYGLALVFVAAATILAFIVDHLIDAPNLSLIFVLPVVLAAVSFGWGPALTAAITGVLAFDFFFVTPRYTFLVASPNDLWALSLLLLIAIVVSSVAAEARRRTVAAREAADQAEALRAFAHVVIGSHSQGEVVRAAATALASVFSAPAVVFMESGKSIRPAAFAGGAEITPADEEAARWSLETQLPTRGEAYPVAGATYDFWPVPTPANARTVMGVSLADYDKGRPREPERLVELVGAYLAAALARDAARS